MAETWAEALEWTQHELLKVVLQTTCFSWPMDAVVQRRHHQPSADPILLTSTLKQLLMVEEAKTV